LTEIDVVLQKENIIKSGKTNLDVVFDIPSNNNLFNKRLKNVIFIGDYKARMILKYSFNDNSWNTMEISQKSIPYDFQDYSSLTTFSNGDMLITGGCNYLQYKYTAKKSSYLIHTVNDNTIEFTPFKPLIVQRFSHGSIIINDIPYVFGMFLLYNLII